MVAPFIMLLIVIAQMIIIQTFLAQAIIERLTTRGTRPTLAAPNGRLGNRPPRTREDTL